MSDAVKTPELAQIDSVQLTEDGEPRFRVPASEIREKDWKDFSDRELAGGVDAEIRAFLDEQLESGDLVLDLNPGAGFVALSAATAPGGVATVFVFEKNEKRLEALQDSAADAGSWVEGLDDESWSETYSVISNRLDQGRLFIHVSASDAGKACEHFAENISDGSLLAVCISGVTKDSPDLITRLLESGLIPCVLGERDGEILLLPVESTVHESLIAVPASLFANGETEEWSARSHGFALIAPHARTGYGIAASNILNSLQKAQYPVALFPLGKFDENIVDNPNIKDAIEAQNTISREVPSVRLSQQFDLSDHFGDGPRVGFTIFESDSFTETELEQLSSLDAVIVCSDWAKEVCLRSGLDDDLVHVVPLGVDMSVFSPDAIWPTEATETVFLQVGKLEGRKGQIDLLRAFEDAFRPDDNVRLILACSNPFVTSEWMNESLAPFRSSPMFARIDLITEELPTARDVAKLMEKSHCGVFPSKAEGWNLEALEMLSMGRHIIASASTAHTHYMNSENSRLIKMGDPEPAFNGSIPGTWPSWGEEQHSQLVQHLQDVHSQRLSGSLSINLAGIDTAKQFTWDSSAEKLIAVLESIF